MAGMARVRKESAENSVVEASAGASLLARLAACSRAEDGDAVAQELEAEDEEQDGHDGDVVPYRPVSPVGEHVFCALAHDQVDGQRCEDPERSDEHEYDERRDLLRNWDSD